MIANAFRLGGWGMFPTLLAGLVFLAFTIRYAIRADRRQVQTVVGVGVLTFIAGLLGFITGMIKTAAHAYEEPRLAIVGFGESLHNVSLALVFLVLGTIIFVVGSWRAASREPARA